MTARAITDLDELKSIVVLGLDLWLVANDSEIIYYKDPMLRQEPSGLFLTNNGHTKVRVMMLGISDPSFELDGQYASQGARIFDNIEAARTQSYNVWMKLNADKFGMKPR